LRSITFGIRIAITEEPKEKCMLKITTIETEAQRRLILDGGIVGPWAAELDKAWQSARDSLGARKLLVDLTGVTVISQDGTHILNNMKSDGAEFVCRGVYVKHVLRNLTTLCKIR
jgi:anti-anti-sigma regulatory factor